jgi:hypothetical protein
MVSIERSDFYKLCQRFESLCSILNLLIERSDIERSEDFFFRSILMSINNRQSQYFILLIFLIERSDIERSGFFFVLKCHSILMSIVIPF